MGMSSALNAGVRGLSVNTSRLSAISDNIANSGTFGYKRATVDFSTVVLGNTSGKYDAGGVRSTSQRQVDGRGSLVTTSNPTDLAIAGRGLLPVTTVTGRLNGIDTRPLMLTSTGAFNVDDEGYLRTASGLQLLGWPALNGVPPANVVRASGADLEPVKVNGFDFAVNATANIEAGINVPATATAGGVFSTGAEYYDNLGAAQTLTMQFTKTANANEWSFTFADSQSGIALGDNTATLLFHPDNEGGGEAGSLDKITPGDKPNYAYAAGSGTLALTLGKQKINLNFGAEDKLGKLTQFATAFAPVALTKDGNPLGTLSRVEVTEAGMLQAIYDTGYRTALYQIPVADVPNLNGLEALDNQAFTITAESGAIYFWNAGEGPTGEMSGYSLEQSTTDIAAELTQLIETQRAYSSNASIVRTVDEMLQETTNLKR